MEQLVERAYATFHEEARKRGIDYRSELHAHPVLMTDGDRVLQIITNLLSNAFRWTPDGGRIELGLDAGERVDRGDGRATRDRGSRRRSRSGSSGRSGRGTAAAPASGSRSRASWRRRSAGGSTSRRRWAGVDVRAGSAERLVNGRRRRRSSSFGLAAAPVRAAFVSLRPRQWPKNLLLFAGIVFAAELGDAARWAEAVGDLRRLLRGVERCVPRQRPAGRGGRPRASRQARSADRARRALVRARARAFSSARRGRAGRRRSARLRVAAVHPRLRSASARVQPWPEAHRARGRRRDRGPVRHPRSRGGGGSRRSDLAVAARLHGAPRALPRSGQASRRARARAG